MHDMFFALRYECPRVTKNLTSSRLTSTYNQTNSILPSLTVGRSLDISKSIPLSSVCMRSENRILLTNKAYILKITNQLKPHRL